MFDTKSTLEKIQPQNDEKSVTAKCLRGHVSREIMRCNRSLPFNQQQQQIVMHRLFVPNDRPRSAILSYQLFRGLQSLDLLAFREHSTSMPLGQGQLLKV